MWTNAGICRKAVITKFKRNKNFWIPEFTLSLALKAAVGVLCWSNDSAHSPLFKKTLGEGTYWNDLLVLNSRTQQIQMQVSAELERKWTVSRYVKLRSRLPWARTPEKEHCLKKNIETLCHSPWKSLTLGNAWISKQVLYQNSRSWNQKKSQDWMHSCTFLVIVARLHGGYMG